MPGINNRKRTIRAAVWGGDSASARDVGESIRDIDRAFKTVPNIVKVSVSQVYSPPLTLRADFVPAAVIVGTCKISKDVTFISGLSAEWTYTDSGQVSITRMFNTSGNLAVGLSFDITFLIFG